MEDCLLCINNNSQIMLLCYYVMNLRSFRFSLFNIFHIQLHKNYSLFDCLNKMVQQFLKMTAQRK